MQSVSNFKFIMFLLFFVTNIVIYLENSNLAARICQNRLKRGHRAKPELRGDLSRTAFQGV